MHQKNRQKYQIVQPYTMYQNCEPITNTTITEFTNRFRYRLRQFSRQFLFTKAAHASGLNWYGIHAASLVIAFDVAYIEKSTINTDLGSV